MRRKEKRSFLFFTLFFIMIVSLLISLNSSAFGEEKKDLPGAEYPSHLNTLEW